MLLVLLRTGLRVSELTQLNRGDVHLGAGAHVHCLGKGRKERCTPLRRPPSGPEAWLANAADSPATSCSPARQGRLTRDAVAARQARYHQIASQECPSLAAKHVTVHTLRHSAAMRLLLAGVDITVIALWLGHESLTSTQAYVHADMQQKQEAIEKTAPPGSKQKRYQPPDQLLEFLENL